MTEVQQIRSEISRRRGQIGQAMQTVKYPTARELRQPTTARGVKRNPLMALLERRKKEAIRQEISGEAQKLGEYEKQFEKEVVKASPEEARTEYKEPVIQQLSAQAYTKLQNDINDITRLEEERQSLSRRMAESTNASVIENLQKEFERTEQNLERETLERDISQKQYNLIQSNPDQYLKEYYSGQLGAEAKQQINALREEQRAYEKRKEVIKEYKAEGFIPFYSKGNLVGFTKNETKVKVDEAGIPPSYVDITPTKRGIASQTLSQIDVLSGAIKPVKETPQKLVMVLPSGKRQIVNITSSAALQYARAGARFETPSGEYITLQNIQYPDLSQEILPSVGKVPENLTDLGIFAPNILGSMVSKIQPNPSNAVKNYYTTYQKSASQLSQSPILNPVHGVLGKLSKYKNVTQEYLDTHDLFGRQFMTHEEYVKQQRSLEERPTYLGGSFTLQKGIDEITKAQQKLREKLEAEKSPFYLSYPSGITRTLYEIPKFIYKHPYLTSGLIVLPSISPILGGLVGAGMGGAWVYGTSKETIPRVSSEKGGTKIGTLGELTGAVVLGGFGVLGGIREISPYFRTFGREYVEPYNLVRPEIIRGEQNFPVTNIADANLHLGLFKNVKYTLPYEVKAEPLVYHVTPEAFKGTTTISRGTSELPGLYVSPEASIYFLKLRTPEYQTPKLPKFLDMVSINTPEILRIRTGGFGLFPKGVSKRQFLLTRAEEGKAYVPGIKTEIEALLKPETKLTRTEKKFYTKIPNVNYARSLETMYRYKKPLMFKRVVKAKIINPLTWWDWLLGYKAGQFKSFGIKKGVPVPINRYDVLTGQAVKTRKLLTLKKASENLEEYTPTSRVLYLSPYQKSYGASSLQGSVLSLRPSTNMLRLSGAYSIESPQPKVSKPEYKTIYDSFESISKASSDTPSKSTISSYSLTPSSSVSSISQPSRQASSFIPSKSGQRSYVSRTRYPPSTPYSKPPQSSSLKLKTKLTQKQLYQLYVKRYGKWLQLGEELPFGLAKRKGVEYTRSTLGASFKLKKGKITSRGIIDIDYNVPQEIFRGYRIKGKMKIPLGNEWIQRASKRLSARTEVREIQAARMKAPKKTGSKIKRIRGGWFK